MSLYNFKHEAGDEENIFVKPFKVAVCLSGQPRHWRTAAKNIHHFFEQQQRHHDLNTPIRVDYFIHTWDTNTWRKPKTDHTVFENVKHDDAQAIYKEFKPKSMICEEFIQENFELAWDPMFYSFARSVRLKREFELANDIQYDIVIKARLDTIYNPSVGMNYGRCYPGVCYTCTPITKFPSEFNYNNFDDVLFWGNSPTMDLVSEMYNNNLILLNSAYRQQNEAGTDLDPALFYGPGCSLYKYLTDNGLHPEGSRVIEYAVVRETAVEQKLDSIENYDEIRKKWFEWYI